MEVSLTEGYFPAGEVGLGGLAVLSGNDAGYVSGIFDGGLGGGTEFTGDVSLTKLYHSGKLSSIQATDFLGTRVSASAGIAIGVKAGVKASYARTRTHSVLGLGMTFGVGLGPIYGAGATLNYGITSPVTLKDLGIFFF